MSFRKEKFVLIIMLSMLSLNCKAGMEFCNRTTETISIAIGYKSGSDWVSEGWWNIYPGECKTVKSGYLPNSYYYYRATSSSGSWEDDYYFCTQSQAFTIYGDDNCSSRGYSRKGFIQLTASGGDTFRNLSHAESDMDRYHSGMILGTWRHTAYEGGYSLRLETTYTNNGQFTMSGSISSGSESVAITGSGTWSISSGYLTERITSSNITEVLPVGFTSTDRIVEITGGKLKVYSSTSRETLTATYVR